MRAILYAIFFFSAIAQARTGEDLKALARVLSESSDLEAIHFAGLGLAEDHLGRLLLFQEQMKALKNIEANENRERLAEDLLIVMTAELGSVEKSLRITPEAMLNSMDPRVRAAATIFVREHFAAKSPEDGFFPLRPNEKERLGGYLEVWAKESNQDFARALSRLGYNMSYDGDKSVREFSKRAFDEIKSQLQQAAADKFPEKARLTSQDERMILALRLRAKIARKYLGALAITVSASSCQVEVVAGAQ